jgi:hypothetical protein
MATPFVQGHLLQKDLTCTVETRCAVSGRSIAFEIESDLRHRVLSSKAQPMLVIPLIDLAALDAPSIVDDF